MQKSINHLLQEAINLLSKQTDIPTLEAELLLAHVLKTTRAYLHTWPDKPVSDELGNRMRQLVLRRSQGEPLAYLTGTKEFWSLDFIVNHDTLIPRPETELLVSAVLERFSHPIKLADLGTGSGAIAIALATEHPDWMITATDRSASALEVARLNADKHHVTNIDFIQGEWCDALSVTDYTVIVSNPPYLSQTEWPHYEQGLQHEPREALVAGEDGLEAIRRIIQQAKQYLETPGYLFLEHGFMQADSVQTLLQQAGYQAITTLTDLAGHGRVTLGKKSG